MFDLDNGVFESEGRQDNRPMWAKQLQGYSQNWEQIDKIKGIVGEIPDNANIDIKTRKTRIGDKSYVVDVYLDCKYLGTYSY